jgi:hypothetical protein
MSGLESKPSKFLGLNALWGSVDIPMKLREGTARAA